MKNTVERLSRPTWCAVAGAVVASGCGAWPGAGEAVASVTFYDMFYTRFATQDTPAPPDGLSSLYRFDARIFTDNVTDMTGAQLRINAGAPIAFDAYAPTLYWLSSASFPDAAGLLAAYPAGTYSYEISGGVLGTQTADNFRSSSHEWAAALPALEGTNFLLIATSYDAGQDQAVVFNAWTPGLGSNGGLTFVTVYGPLDVPFATVLGNTETTCTIPANMLQPDTEYTLSIVFSSRIETDNAGFGTATAISGFDNSTSIRFRTLPANICLADVDDGSGTGTRDGGVGVEDLLYFLSLYAIGDVGADVDDGSGTGTRDGGVGIEDLLYFLFRYEMGC